MSDNSKIISAIFTVSKCDIDRSNESGSKFKGLIQFKKVSHHLHC
jgi:hypothetical protein